METAILGFGSCLVKNIQMDNSFSDCSCLWNLHQLRCYQRLYGELYICSHFCTIEDIIPIDIVNLFGQIRGQIFSVLPPSCEIISFTISVSCYIRIKTFHAIFVFDIVEETLILF